MSIPRYQTFDTSPRAPTPAPGDNSTKVATTAYVDAAVTAASGNLLIDPDTGDFLTDPVTGDFLSEP
jgi:hypothetical protein